MTKTANKELNKEQLIAVEHGEGPLLIIAGAGTGKTTVITERIKWLVSQKKALPSQILALTFTDKAARAMESRVDQALPYGYTQMWISTFHNFGEKILRSEAVHIGLDSGYKLMTVGEAVIFFRKNIFKFELEYFRPLGNPNKFIEGMLSHFSRLKDEDITPDQYMGWSKSQNKDKEDRGKYIELAEAYKKYEELKVKEGVMDFADLISNTLKLFRTRKNILKQYQKQFKYILIDEFQDTNFAQNELTLLLAGAKKNITVVGDDDQAIYRFRGAAVSNIIQFRKRFPGAKLVTLRDNYRSTQAILDTSYKLIQFNNPDRLEAKEKINKKLEGVRKLPGKKIELIYKNRVENEAEKVVEKIKNLKMQMKNAGGEEIYSWQDFAILIRANNHAEPFSRALERAGIPYQFLGPGMLFRQPEIKDLIAYLKILYNFDDSVAVFRVLSMDIFSLSARDLSALLNFSKKIGVSLYQGIEIVVSFYKNDSLHWSRGKNYENYLPNLGKDTFVSLKKFLEMVERHLALSRKDSAGQILYYFLDETGLLEAFTSYKTVKDESIALNISKFFDKLKTYEVEHEDASVTAVIDWIDMSLELGESPLAVDTDWTDNNAVNILTLHSAKGLEFGVVFLVNLVNNRFPTTLRREQIPIPEELVKEILPEGDYHIEEERRLFYVGMTRARDYLFLTAANYYGEGKRERKISPFVIDALGEEEVKKTILNLGLVKKTRQLNLLEWKKEKSTEKPLVRKAAGYLSYSQISTFLTCPLQYKYRYILKIPVPPTAAGSFGTSMHAALQKFYEYVKKGEKPGKKNLLKILDKVWLPVGYGTLDYEEKMKKRGRDMLSRFFENVYNPKIIPRDLEQVFNIKVTPELTVGGKIDRVDDLPQGKLEIIDYKTGKRPPEKIIRDNLQMTLYALAATDEGLYNKKPEQVTLTFYFFDQYASVSGTRSPRELEEAKEKIKKVASDIAESDFPAHVGAWCDFCDFRLICEAWQ